MHDQELLESRVVEKASGHSCPHVSPVRLTPVHWRRVRLLWQPARCPSDPRPISTRCTIKNSWSRGLWKKPAFIDTLSTACARVCFCACVGHVYGSPNKKKLLDDLLIPYGGHVGTNRRILWTTICMQFERLFDTSGVYFWKHLGCIWG